MAEDTPVNRRELLIGGTAVVVGAGAGLTADNLGGGSGGDAPNESTNNSSGARNESNNESGGGSNNESGNGSDEPEESPQPVVRRFVEGDGDGTGLIELPSTEGFNRLTATHSGEGVFSVEFIGNDGDTIEQAFTGYGEVDSTEVLPLDGGVHTVQVTASGEWRLSSGNASPTRESPPAVLDSSNGVYGPVALDGAHEVIPSGLQRTGRLLDNVTVHFVDGDSVPLSEFAERFRRGGVVEHSGAVYFTVSDDVRGDVTIRVKAAE